MSKVIEKQVVELYTKHQILDVRELTPQTISERLDIGFEKYDGKSESLIYKGQKYIFLNNQLHKNDEWFQFCHELGHLQMHCGNQMVFRTAANTGGFGTFLSYQEFKANHFALHACAPTHILDAWHVYKMDAFKQLCFLKEVCKMDEQLAQKRLQYYRDGKMMIRAEREVL